MTICGGQRDAPRNTIPKTSFRRDAGPSTALAGYFRPACFAKSQTRLAYFASLQLFAKGENNYLFFNPTVLYANETASGEVE